MSEIVLERAKRYLLAEKTEVGRSEGNQSDEPKE